MSKEEKLIQERNEKSLNKHSSIKKSNDSSSSSSESEHKLKLKINANPRLNNDNIVRPKISISDDIDSKHLYSKSNTKKYSKKGTINRSFLEDNKKNSNEFEDEHEFARNTHVADKRRLTKRDKIVFTFC